VKSISTKIQALRQFAQLAMASIHQMFGHPGRNVFTAA